MSTRFASAAAAVALTLPIAIGSAAFAQNSADTAAPVDIEKKQQEIVDKLETRERPTTATPRDYGVKVGGRRASDDPVVVGAFVYSQRCSVCHATSANGQQKYGPHLEGIVGRKAGSTEWPKQTNTLNASEVVWDEESLDALLQNPDKMMPGLQMDVKVRFKRSRKALIAYLKSL